MGRAFLLLLLPISINAGDMMVWNPKEIRNSALEEYSGSIQWTEYIVPAPMIISLLGQLAILSNQHIDFELTAPHGGSFRHILYPDSMKTTLMQVCDESYYTFQAAHHNMDKLRQQSARVPRLLTDIVELLLTGTDDDINDYLPILVSGIKKVAQQSKELSEETANKFNQTAILIDEVTLASKSSEGKSKTELEQAKVDVEISKKNMELRKEQRRESKAALHDAKSKAAEAESQYKEALDNIPSGWELLGMKLTETAIDLAKTGAKMALDAKFGTLKTFAITEGIKKGSQLTDKVFGLNKRPPSQATRITQESDMKLLEIRSSILQAAIQSFSKGLFEQTIQNKGELSLKCSETANIGNVEGFMDELKKIKSEQIELDTDIETNLKDALSTLQDTLVETKKCCLSNSTSNVTALSQELQKVESKLDGAIIKMKISLRESTLPPPPPTSTPTKQEETTNSDVVSQTVKNTQAAVTATKQMLTFRAKEVNKQREAWKTATNEFMKVQEEIMTLDAKIASMEDIIKLLKQALKVLAQLSKQWRKMALFFDMLNTMVQTWEEGPQKQFIEIVEKGSENTMKQKRMTVNAKKLMFGYARESAGYAFVINRVSTGYFKISSKYLLIPMASLKELMTIEASNEKLLNEQKNELKSQAAEAMACIKSLGDKESERTKNMLGKKMEDIDKKFNDVLAKIPPKVKQAVIQDTMNTMKKLNYKKTEVSIVQHNLEQFSKIGDDSFLDDDDFLNF